MKFNLRLMWFRLRIIPLSRTEMQTALREQLASRTVSSRIGELCGSLVVAALACGIFAFLGLAVGGNMVNPDASTWAFYGWLVGISVACQLGYSACEQVLGTQARRSCNSSLCHVDAWSRHRLCQFLFC